MTSENLRERLALRARHAGVSVPPEALPQLEAYYRLLARWNRRINLTGFSLETVTNSAIDRLIVEPLAASRFVDALALVWFDVGSGGGSPAIPLRTVRPAARLAMVESKARKAAFLREVIRALKLDQTTVEETRFEELAAARADLRECADLISVRAVRADKALFDGASTLLRRGGQLFLFGAAALAKPPRGFEQDGCHGLTDSAGSRLLVLRRGR